MEKRKVLAVPSAYLVLNLHQIINQNVVRKPSFASEMDMLFFVTCLAVNKYRRGRNRDVGWRRVWAWPRPQNWFDVPLVSPAWYLSLWRPNFQMSRQTYNELCNVLRPDSIKQDTGMRRPVSVEKRVAVVLWRLDTGDMYRSCVLQYGIGESTAKVISEQFESALCRLKNSYIRFSYTDEEVQEVMDCFEEEYHFPQIAGAIDGSHIEIRAAPDNHKDYYNRKQFYSLVLRWDVAGKLLFRHNSFGYPGSVHNSRVLRLSGLADLAEKGQILKSPTKIIQGYEVRPMLAGDSAYPLSVWLLKPFSTRENLLREEKKFNEKFSAMRAIVERAFGMLKRRWRILAKKNEQHYKSVSRNNNSCLCSP